MKNNKIVDYEIPLDGEGYGDSLRLLFPPVVRKKIDADMQNNELIRKIERHLEEQAKEYFNVSETHWHYE